MHLADPAGPDARADRDIGLPVGEAPRIGGQSGEVTEAARAEALKAESGVFSPVCNKFIQLAENLDLDGILNLARELSK